MRSRVGACAPATGWSSGRDPATLLVSVRGLAAADLDAGLLAAYGRLGVGHVGVMLPVAGDGGAAAVAVAALEGLAQRVPEAVQPG